MSSAGGIFTALEQAAAEALTQGRPVLVVGPWGSGRKRLLDQCVSENRRPDLVPVTDVHLLSKSDAADLAERVTRGQPALMTAARGATSRPDLRRAIAAAGAQVIELGPITPSQAGLLARHRCGTHLDDQTVHQLLRWSSGIYRLLEALIDDGQAQGWLATDGVVSAGWPHVLVPGSSLRRAVDDLLDTFTRPQREVMTTLMCTGPVPVSIADIVFPVRPVDALQADGLLEERSGEGVADLVIAPGALFEGASAWVTPRGRRGRLARVAATIGEPQLDHLSLHQRVRIAGWAAASGPVALVRQGVRPAVLVGDLDTAVVFGRYVTSRDPEDRLTRETVVMALEATGHHSEAVALTRDGPSTVDSSTRARLAANTYLSTLDESLAHGLAPTAVTASDDDGEAAANLGWLQLFTGNVDDVTAASSAVLVAKTSSAQARVWSSVQYAVAEVVAGGNESEAVLGAAARVVQTHAEELTPYSAFQVEWTRCVVLVRLGRAAEVLATAAAALVSTSDPQLVAAWHGVAGLAGRELGDFDNGRRHFEAIGDSLSGDPFGLGTWAASEHRVCSSMLGRLEGPVQDGAPIGFTESLVQRNAAWSVAAADPDDGRARASEAAGLAHLRGQSTHEMLALVDLARFGAAGQASARAAQIPRIENPLIRAGGQVVSAMARRRTDELLAAAEAAAGVGWWVVRAELLVLLRHVLVSDGQLHAAALVELRTGPSRWPTPILTRDDTPRFVTQRECEVGAPAARGVRSDAIAEQLGISGRTVDNLLGRLYHKCGVRGRVELTAALGSLGLRSGPD